MSNNQNQQPRKNDPLERNEIASGQSAEQAAAELVAKQAREMEAAIQGKALNNPVASNTGRIDSGEFDIPDEGPLGIDEIRKKAHAALDTPELALPGKMTEEELEYAAFMEEKVIIVVHDSTNEEELAVVCPMVNGQSQPIVRGYPTPVRRKYVEVLARAKETKYKQQQRDSNDPASLEMVPRTVLAFPFSIERDDNPRGREWLKNIIRSPG